MARKDRHTAFHKPKVKKPVANNSKSSQSPISPTPKVSISQHIIRQPEIMQKESFWKKFEQWVESPLVLSGGAAMFLSGIGLVISNAPKLSLIALLLGWSLFVWSIFKHNFYADKPHKEQVIRKSITSLLLGLGFFVFWLVLLPSPEKIRVYFVPAGESTPENPCSEVQQMFPRSITLLFGDSAAMTDGDSNMNILAINGKPWLTARKIGENIQISFELFNSEGVSIAKIKDNTFVGEVAGSLDFKPNDHGIDIWDKTNDKHIFHLRYLNPETIEILGELYTNKGKHLLQLKPDGVLYDGIADFSNASFKHNCVTNSYGGINILN